MNDIYLTLYTALQNTVFGGSIDVGSAQDIVATLFSCMAVLLLIAFPFLIVYKIIATICGW